MKKNIVILFLIIMLMPICVYADEVEIAGTGVYIRNLPGTNGAILGTKNNGARYTLKSGALVPNQGGCNEGWYNIDYEGQNAYVCSKFVRVIVSQVTNVDMTNCFTEMSSKGFPSNYVNKICELKAKHPNWEFNPVITGLDFKTAVEKESQCGKNTINTNVESYKDLTCKGNFDSGYVGVSQTAAAQFLNPLNYITESGVFMFESNRINANINDESYRNVIPKIISNFMVTNLPTLPNAINIAGRNKNVSQVILSARIKQEIGEGKATSNTYKGKLLSCICGEYTTRWGTLYNGESLDHYYNFFNIGVYDGSNGDAAYKAVTYAKRAGWGGTGNQEQDLSLAIGGGAEFLKSKYIEAGQDTIYFQKFNVHPTNASKLYINQYMSNIQAAASESSIVYNAYKNANLLSSPFVFLIPVYNNMDAVITNSANGAISTGGVNTSNGMDIGTIIVSSGHKVQGSTISPPAGTSFEDFKNQIGALGGTIKGDTSGIIGTGKKVIISNGDTQAEYTFVVKGDTSGDGVINALDLLQVQKSILNQYKLNNEYKTAGDTSGDGVVNALDLLQIQKSILGQYKIG